MNMENEGCYRYMEGSIDIYLGTLLNVAYKDLNEKSRKFIFSMYEHLKICGQCRDDYIETKRDFASNTAYTEMYPPKSFRLLKENEACLEKSV